MSNYPDSSAAGERNALLDWAAAAVRKNPQALFTNFQWFLYHSKNTVYFTAYSKTAFTKESLDNFVAEMVSLAPQLTHGFKGALPGQPFPKHILDAITSVAEVDSFDGYPDKWLGKGLDIFERQDLPLFRVYAITLRGGPDAQGHASMVLVRSSHALLEGHDSSLLTRSQSIARTPETAKPKVRLPFKRRMKLAMGSLVGATLQLYYAHKSNLPVKNIQFRSLAITRSRIRALANRIGVRQRSLMFGLITQALNVAEKGPEAKVITAAYTMLDNSERSEVDDDQFRVRALMATFPVKSDFIDYVRAIDATLTQIEARDTTTYQFILMGMFALHRRISKALPFLYTDKFFRFNRTTDVVLTLVPPHRMYGNMTRDLVEPVYVGSFHPSANLCTFVPNRQYITLNFAMEQRYLDRVDDIVTLLEQTEQREIHAAPPPAESQTTLD
ncbi:MAG: hypothetical protein JWR39_535 [Devosia sp.]|nr:hypothetical protein [Devosia sp.]